MPPKRRDFAELCAAAIRQARVQKTETGAQFMLSDMVAIIRQHCGPKGPPAAKRTMKLAADEDWLKELEADPAMAGIDVKQQLGKCQFWCKNNRAICTRARFTNWLLKADRHVGFNGAGQSSHATKGVGTVEREPKGWRETLITLHPSIDRAELDAKKWLDLSSALRTDILKAQT